MATAAQIIANQANASHSTGPKPAEGKARAAKNATRHGYARFFIVGPERQAEFLQFEANLRDAVQPQGALEEGAFLQLRDAAWRLESLRAEGNADFAEQTQNDPLTLDDFEKQAAAANRARAAAEMQLYRAFNTLRELQTTSLARFIHLTADEEESTPACAAPKSFTHTMVDGFFFNRADREVFAETNGFMPPPQPPVTTASATP